MAFAYRKTWKCGEKRVHGELTIDLDNGCGQDIYQSKEKHSSGKYKILNLRDGEGGYTDMPHVCPKRVGSKFHHFTLVNMREYDWHQQNYPCVVCATVYNKEKYPLCPTCMKLECRKCGNLQHWVVGKGILCFECGAMCDPRSVKYMFEEAA